jgi:alkyl hydroperoxide reductase subunit AhpC
VDDDVLRIAFRWLDPRGREALRRVAIVDHESRDRLAQQLIRHRSRSADELADLIDMLTLDANARQAVARVLGELQAVDPPDIDH